MALPTKKQFSRMNTLMLTMGCWEKPTWGSPGDIYDSMILLDHSSCHIKQGIWNNNNNKQPTTNNKQTTTNNNKQQQTTTTTTEDKTTESPKSPYYNTKEPRILRKSKQRRNQPTYPTLRRSKQYDIPSETDDMGMYNSGRGWTDHREQLG